MAGAGGGGVGVGLGVGVGGGAGVGVGGDIMLAVGRLSIALRFELVAAEDAI
jgi:hypothetical protein